MSVPSHTHPELEDRLTAEVSAVHTELIALRADTRRGLAAVTQAIAHLAALVEGGHDA